MDKQLEKRLEASREYFRKAAKGLSNFTIMFEKSHDTTIGYVCHAPLGYGLNGKQPVGVLDWIHIPANWSKDDKKEYAKLVSWAVNRGPLKGVGKRTAATRVLDEGVWIDASQPSSALLGLITMYRTHKEFKHLLDTFKALRKDKVSIEVAWMVSLCVSPLRGKTYLPRYFGGHDVFHEYSAMTEVVAFLAGKRQFPRSGSYRSGERYRVNDYCGGQYNGREGSISEWKEKHFNGEQERKFGQRATASSYEDVLKACSILQEMIDERKKNG